MSLRRKSGQPSSTRIQRSFGALQSKTFDLGVIGAGPVGAGVARRAAAAGLSVALLESTDYSSGLVANPARLLSRHSGRSWFAHMKYLREAAYEHRQLHQMAPHVVQPATMIAPIRDKLTSMKFRFSLAHYESPAVVSAGERAQRWDRKRLADQEPILDGGLFSGAWLYRDFLVDEARLVLALLRDASRFGAECANYVCVNTITQKSGRYFLNSRDELSGREFAVRCQSVVDTVTPRFGPNRESDFCFAKNVHIAVPQQKLPLKYPMVMETADKGSVFAIPQGQVTYLGAANLRASAEIDSEMTVSEADIQYLLSPLLNYFSIEEVRPIDVVASWAGLHPMLNDASIAGTQIPRGREVIVDRDDIIRIRGGDSVIHDLLAEEALSHVRKVLDRSVSLDYELGPLPGSKFSRQAGLAEALSCPISAEIKYVKTRYNIDEATARRLVRLYGDDVVTVLGEEPVALSQSVFVEEVDWAVLEEGALTLEDILYRRLRCVWFEPQELMLLLPALTERAATLLEWDALEQTRQRIAFEDRLALDLAAVPLAD